jgi:hypothetical protein
VVILLDIDAKIRKYLEDITGLHVNSKYLRVYTEHLKHQSSFTLFKKCEICATKAGLYLME